MSKSNKASSRRRSSRVNCSRVSWRISRMLWRVAQTSMSLRLPLLLVPLCLDILESTRVTKGDGWNGISTLSHPENPIELEIQAGSKADRAHNTHTKLMVDRKSSGKPNEKVMSKVVKLQKKKCQKVGSKDEENLSIHTRWKTNGVSTTGKMSTK